MNAPAPLNPLAARVLELLSGKAGADQIVLGGYFALQHYLNHRTTHDIDAWWAGRAEPQSEEAIRAAMRQVAGEQVMELRERRFGDTLSFELVSEGVQRFSFQIAVRSVAIDKPQPSPWTPILIETLPDNVGSKMNALVNRGAPRDFLDIKAVVEAGLLPASECWALWSAKNPDGRIEAARQNVLLHLAELEARRPLDTIPQEQDRARAGEVRRWFREEFTRS